MYQILMQICMPKIFACQVCNINRCLFASTDDNVLCLDVRQLLILMGYRPKLLQKCGSFS